VIQQARMSAALSVTLKAAAAILRITILPGMFMLDWFWVQSEVCPDMGGSQIPSRKHRAPAVRLGTRGGGRLKDAILAFGPCV
jgi:hypothetical protein